MSSCLLCSLPLDEAVLISTTSRHGHPSRRVACLQCGLVQVSPQPTEGELLSFYSSHAYRAEHGPVPLTVTYPSGMSRTIAPTDPDYEDALEAMANYRWTWASQRAGLIPGMRCLELGSGDGRTLAAFARGGLAVTGVEPDRSEAEASRARLPSGRVLAESIDEFLLAIDQWGTTDEERAEAEASTGAPFDVISMFHVLEHLHRPREVLRKLRSMLTPRGALVIEVPNILQPSPDLDGYHFQHVHLTDFSEHTLLAALVLEQYEPVWITADSNLRCVARPATHASTYDVPIAGVYVKAYLDGVRWLHGAMGGGR